MDNERVIIKGYQPRVHWQEGYQPVVDVPKGKQKMGAVAAEIKIVPPRGGSGETVLKKK